MKRFLPPIVVLVVLIAVVVRVAKNPSHDKDRLRIETAWATPATEPHHVEVRASEISQYIEDYGENPERLWFGLRALVKNNAYDRALGWARRHPKSRSDPAMPGRIAQLVLRAIAFEDDEKLERPGPPAPLVAIALAEGGDQQALEWIVDALRGGDASGVAPLVKAIFMASTERVTGPGVAALRTRTEPRSLAAASFMVMSPDSYEERQEDIDRLIEAVGGSWRTAHRPMWSACCQTLGRSEDPVGMEHLWSRVDELRQSTQAADLTDAAVAACGLVAGGDWTAEESIGPFLQSAETAPYVAPWFLEAVVYRYLRGDPRGLDGVLRVWESQEDMPVRQIRPRLGAAVLLRDPWPREDLPVERLLSDLESEEAEDPERAIAVAFRLRRGDEDAISNALDFLGELLMKPDTGRMASMLNPNLRSPLITICRALMLYTAPTE